MTYDPLKCIAEAVQTPATVGNTTSKSSQGQAAVSKTRRPVEARARDAITTEAGTQSGRYDEGTAKRNPPQRNSLMKLTIGCDLWHGGDGEAFCTFPVNEHRESWPVRSSAFRRSISSSAPTRRWAWCQVDRHSNTENFRGVCNEFGPEQSPWRRVGHCDGSLYLDLCDPTWRAVEITSDGFANSCQARSSVCPLPGHASPSGACKGFQHRGSTTLH